MSTCQALGAFSKIFNHFLVGHGATDFHPQNILLRHGVGGGKIMRQLNAPQLQYFLELYLKTVGTIAPARLLAVRSITV